MKKKNKTEKINRDEKPMSPFEKRMCSDEDKQQFVMQQLLLNISDISQVSKLMRLLNTLNYVNVAPYCEENLIVSEKEKNLIRERVSNAKPEDFNSWDNFIDAFEKYTCMKKFSVNEELKIIYIWGIRYATSNPENWPRTT